MSTLEPNRERTLSEWRPRRGDLALAAGTLAALFAAMLPLVRVISFGWWLPVAIGFATLVFATGILMRGLRVPAVGVSLAEAAVWVASVTGIFFSGTSILLVIPTLKTFAAGGAAVRSALEDIQYGSAPLTPRIGLTIVIAALTGLLAIVFDHVVLTARMPMLAAVGFIALSLAPSIAVPADFDPAAFVLLAVCILFLIRIDTQLRREQGDTTTSGRSHTVLARAGTGQPAVSARSSTTAMAAGIGAIGLVVALILTPLLPPPVARAGFGGATVSIDPTLRLGEDLRRPVDAVVLTVHTTGAASPYTRVATISHFTDADWRADTGSKRPVGHASSFPKVRVDPGIAVTKTTATVNIVNLSSKLLPVPYPVTGVTNLGAEWSVMNRNGTIAGSIDTFSGQTYSVTTSVPQPTSQQIRASSATDVDAQLAGGSDTIDLPGVIPSEITRLAKERTSGAATDYDALLALQNWFRGPDFTYSLLAPRSDGFDTAGLRAIDMFLVKKQGYCIHFASSFAVMARVLGMHSRIVVGYLPGTSSSQLGADPALFTVMSSQLHAWPEVYFRGIGWVPFEPTKGLGVPTAFAAATRIGPDGEVAPTPTSSSSSSAAPRNNGGNKLDVTNDTRSKAAAAAITNPVPWVGGAVGLLIAACVPSVLGVWRRRRLLAVSHQENAPAAWMYVQEAAIDVGLVVPASESPRAFAGRLAQNYPIPPEDMAVLLSTIERASYGRGGLRGQWQGDALADAAASVRSALLASVPASVRWRAVLMPRSLFVRPGSVYAGAAGSEHPAAAR